MKSKSSFSQIASKSLLIIILFLSFSFVTFTQNDESSDESEIKLPDEVMQQVVKRILVYSFKPRKKPTTIYLAEEGIKESWLPKIKNINFKFLSDEEVKKIERKIYFFKQFPKEKKNYSIGFAFGNPNCNYLGKSSWSFRIVKEKVRLWREIVRREFAGGCGTTISPSKSIYSSP